MGNYDVLYAAMGELSNARILILDNNNLEFCTQHQSFFPPGEVFKNYDLILVPEWVHAEISHSDNRLEYLASIPENVIIITEEEDYLELMNGADYKLMLLFGHASSSISTARKVINEFKKYYDKNSDLPDNWIEEFSERGFEVKRSKKIEAGEEVVIELRKNAGETSILVLAYLLLHRFPGKIKHVTIFSSDKGSLTIKKGIMDNLSKMEIIETPSIPIGFKSTDILLIEAYKEARIQLDDIDHLRKNNKTVIYTHKLDDFSSHRQEYVMTTAEFKGILNDIDKYHFEF